VRDLVDFQAVQQELQLGPNGALMYCMEHLATHASWLGERLAPHLASGAYLILDVPGQVELLTAHDALQRLLAVAEKQWHLRLAAVHLVDSHLCADASKFLAALLLSLDAQLHLGLPHVNVLSKVDLVESLGPLPFALDFYTRGGDGPALAAALGQEPRLRRFAKLTRSLCEVVEDYGLVGFETLDVQDEASMRHLVGVVDKANGWVFAGLAAAAAARGEAAYSPAAYSAAVSSTNWPSERLMDVTEKHMPLREQME